VLEIGPGKGSLTRALIDRGFKVTAIERDAALIPGLRDALPGVTLIPADALRLDWPSALGLERRSDPWFAVGNIPYYITSPLIEKALSPPRPRSVVFLVQRDVAVRLAAAPGNRDYGAITVGVSAVARVERLFPVPAGAFHPRPRVESAVIRLTPLSGPVVSDPETPAFRHLVTRLFAARRKQLIGALRTALRVTRVEAGALLDAADLSPTIRPETLEVVEFARLLRVVVDGGWGEALAL